LKAILLLALAHKDATEARVKKGRETRGIQTEDAGKGKSQEEDAGLGPFISSVGQDMGTRDNGLA
jgi:hypothetical protein